MRYADCYYSQDLFLGHSVLIDDQSGLIPDGVNNGSPLMINPNNPIRDPSKFNDNLILPIVTKKRLRACANMICGYKSYGTEANFWSRRKFSKGKFFWLCKPCAEAYNKGQFCDYCKQIYYEGEGTITDGKQWIQCE